MDSVFGLAPVSENVARRVASTVHYLSQESNAHQGVSPHATALSTLAASALPVTILAATDSSTPAIPADNSLAELKRMLAAPTQPIPDQVAAGNAPSAVNATFKPETLTEERHASYRKLLGISSMAQLYASIMDLNTRQERHHPKPYRLSDHDEAVQAFADQADFAWAAMTGPLSGFYIFTTAPATQFKRSFTRAELHEGFLGEVFKGFNLSDGAVKSLDTILTNFASSVSTIKFEEQVESQTINQTLRINTTPAYNITGDNDNPDYVYTPTTHVIYMKIKAATWKTSLSKPQGGGSVENVDFEMEWVAPKFELNVDLYDAAKPKFDAICKYLTSKNLEDYGACLEHSITDKNQDTLGK